MFDSPFNRVARQAIANEHIEYPCQGMMEKNLFADTTGVQRFAGQ